MFLKKIGVFDVARSELQLTVEDIKVDINQSVFFITLTDRFKTTSLQQTLLFTIITHPTQPPTQPVHINTHNLK